MEKNKNFLANFFAASFHTIKKPAISGGSFNGGSDEARTRDLLRDRQAL